MDKEKHTLRTAHIKIERDRIGPPGVYSYLFTLDKLQGDKRTDEEKLRDKEEREFEVKCALGKNFTISEEIQASLPEGYGESYLLIPQEEDESIVSTPQGEYHFKKNANNEISIISLVCRSRSWQNAFGTFFSGITPFLDILSYQSNIPIVIQKVFCRDKKNSLSVVSYITPYAKTLIKPHGLPPVSWTYRKV